MAEQLVINATGDVAPCRPDPGSMFAELGGAFDADCVFGQMECVLSDRGSPAPNARLPMRSPPSIAANLASAGFDVMSVAGNHAMDFGGDALCDTVDHLREAGIVACGGGANLAQARKPAMLERGGRKLAFLAYSSILPAGYAAENNRPGCAPLRAHTLYEQVEPDQPGTDPRIHTYADENDLAALLEDIRIAREGADHVFVSMHWGIHFVRAKLADYQRAVGRQIIDAGADAVIGHHPHLLKPIEFHRGRPIIHSLGNFAIEQPSAYMANIEQTQGYKEVTRTSAGWKPKEKYMLPEETRHTAVASLQPGVDGCRLSLIPFRIDDDCVPCRLDKNSPEFADFTEYLTAITRETGIATNIADTGDGMLELSSA
ncbi:CapA family protein [Aurantiacibacter poecillastricola]|uniref:CapA family protein n=1 Tax=Aurantiacibacter poecillastricola TaxID=3064385 RepID=UPI00273EF098|nr:CapA family protein [Aurantiacibacter sp. 219JJ12-13]MDP5261289.1 CapA family protein [Aurantiacibacter sp. 219JJ12-13]